MRVWINAYRGDLQYITGRLRLAGVLRRHGNTVGAGQVLSDLLDHLDHNVEALRRLAEQQTDSPRAFREVWLRHHGFDVAGRRRE